MIIGSIARRYAKAIFIIAEEKGNLLGLTREVQRMSEVWQESPELRETMSNPLIDQQTKREIWNGIIRRLGVSQIGKNFFSLLFDKSRCGYLIGIARELGVLFTHRFGRYHVVDVRVADTHRPQTVIDRLQLQPQIPFRLQFTAVARRLEYRTEARLECLAGFRDLLMTRR